MISRRNRCPRLAAARASLLLLFIIVLLVAALGGGATLMSFRPCPPSILLRTAQPSSSVSQPMWGPRNAYLRLIKSGAEAMHCRNILLTLFQKRRV